MSINRKSSKLERVFGRYKYP